MGGCSRKGEERATGAKCEHLWAPESLALVRRERCVSRVGNAFL